MSDVDAAVSARLESWTADGVAERLWAKDGSLWAASGKPPQEVAAWLGWLDLPATMSARVAELEHLARDVREDGYRRAAVLGMGGSSLAPELFSRVFGRDGSAGGLELRILDSTHPDVVRGFRSWAGEQRTIFCVSSKSGSTTEPNAFQAAMGEIAPALDFIAITDPGSSLGELARAQEFRAIIEAPPDVGGRYSALTVFGLVPAALSGVDLAGLLARATRMADACHTGDAAANPGLRLGALIGEAALAGRDKLTILTSARLAAFGDWAEQLIAESTGKAGKGIVPIVGEPAADPSEYGDDRCFVYLRFADESDPAMSALADEELVLDDALDVGAEFVRWEVATAAAGIVLGIDPFDQPNVQESKDATTELLDEYRSRGRLPQPGPLVSEAGISVSADPGPLGDTPVTVDGAVRNAAGPAPAGARLLRDPRLPAARSRGRGAPPAHSQSRPADARRRHHAGLRPTFPALDRAAPQGRARHGGLPPAHRRAVQGPAHPRLAGVVRHPDRGAGARRPHLAPAPRAAGDAAALRRSRRRARAAGVHGRRGGIGLARTTK